MATYVLLIGNLLVHRPDSNTLEATALEAAAQLSRITVSDARFGLIGLCDLPAEEYSIGLERRVQAKVNGINKVYGSLRLIALIADRLHHPVINNLLSQDLIKARELENELAIKLRSAVESRPVEIEPASDFLGLRSLGLRDYDASDRSSIYQKVYRRLSKALAVHDSKLIGLTIKLGFLRSRAAFTMVSAPELTESTAVNDNGDYTPGVPVFVPNLAPIMFIPLSNKTQNLSPEDFVDDRRQSAPTAVLIKAEYEYRPIGHQTNTLKVTRSACAAVGATNLPPPPAALVITFPQGAPDLFHSVNDILNYRNWKSLGFWRQAINGDVPGLTSKLVCPSDPTCTSMTPSDALAKVIYDWLKLLESDTDVEKCVKLISAGWTIPVGKGLPTGAASANQNDLNPVNSCLSRDNGTRSNAICEQSYPGGLGQTAVSSVFSKSAFNPTITPPACPSSAIPLFVDSSGKCNLAGCDGFNSALIKDFLTAVYDTNLAALESLWTAKYMASKLASQKPELLEKVSIEKQELSSIDNRINRLASQKSGERTPQAAAVSRQIELLKEKVSTLQKTIGSEQMALERISRLGELTKQAIENASNAANQTYDLTAHAFRICRGGIVPIASDSQAFLLGRKLCFLAHRKPLAEADFFEEESNYLGKAVAQNRCQSWLSKHMNVTIDADELINKNNEKRSHEDYNSELTLLSKQVKAIKDKQETIFALRPFCVILDSQSVARVKDHDQRLSSTLPSLKGPSASKEIKPNTYTSYPFFNIFIPDAQLLYYCQHAIETGKNPAVSWSVLIRDLVHNKLQGRAGVPVNSFEPDWCKKQGEAIGFCPGLSCEFQLRTPLPILNDFPEGSYVADQSGKRVSQLPPVPAEML